MYMQYACISSCKIQSISGKHTRNSIKVVQNEVQYACICSMHVIGRTKSNQYPENIQELVIRSCRMQCNKHVLSSIHVLVRSKFNQYPGNIQELVFRSCRMQCNMHVYAVCMN